MSRGRSLHGLGRLAGSGPVTCDDLRSAVRRFHLVSECECAGEVESGEYAQAVLAQNNKKGARSGIACPPRAL